MGCAGLLLVFSCGVFAQPPSNCWDAIELLPNDEVEGYTVGQPTSASLCNVDFQADVGSVVYKVTMMEGKDLLISTCNAATNYHSALTVFAYSCDVPVCIESAYTTPRDCGHEGGTYINLPSSTVFQEVYIMVSGIREVGYYRLTLQSSTPDETWGDCSRDTLIMGPSSLTGIIYEGSDEDDGTPSCEIDSNVSVEWFTYTPYAANTKVTITTCSPDTDFDTIIGVMDAPEDATYPCDAECLEVSDNYCFGAEDLEGVTASTVVYNAVGNIPNRFFVTGKGGSFGNFHLTIKESTVVGPPACRGSSCGASCSAALPAGVGEFPGNLSHANNQANHLICGRINPDDHVAWYEFLPPVRAKVTISTCDHATNFDTVLAVVSDCDSYTCVAMNDDAPCLNADGASTIIINVEPFVLYHIAVAGFAHGQGEFLLIIDGDLEEDVGSM